MIWRDGFLAYQRYRPLKSIFAKQGGGRSPGVARAKDHHMRVRSARRSPLSKTERHVWDVQTPAATASLLQIGGEWG